jgi:hypothetical protein
MRKIKLLVAMQHALTDEQMKQIESCDRLGAPIEVEYLKNVDTELFDKLSSLTGSEDLYRLAKELHNTIIKGGFVGAVLPIGSPAFMAEFVCVGYTDYSKQPAMIFAHSDRISVDNGDGTKTTKFIHKGWIGSGQSGKVLAFNLNNGKLII